jgi:hypothetical protein
MLETMLQGVLNKPFSSIFNPPRILVDGSVSKGEDDVGAIEKTTVEGVGTAERAATLNDVVVAGEVFLGDTAEGATAC